MVVTAKPNDLDMCQYAVPTPYVVGDIKVYTFEVNGELILFDTGPRTDDALQFLQGNIDLDRLKYVFITHWHPEHCGLAQTLEKETPAEIVISRNDTYKFLQPERHLQQLSHLFLQLGFTADEVDRQTEIFRKLKARIPTPQNYRLLEESQDLLDHLDLTYFNCPWHCGSDVIYLLGNYAISGDIVLKGIFSVPFIEADPVLPTDRFSNYTALCEAISQLKRIENYTFLPSHQDRVASIDEWVEFFVTKIVERTRTLAPLLQSGNSVYETAVKYFGEKMENRFLLFIKASEVALSKDFLDAPEQLTQALKKNGLFDKMGHLLEV